MSRSVQLAAIAALAAIVVAAAAIASSPGGSDQASTSSTTTVASAASEAAQLFQGIPETNGVLGATTAGKTVTEFVDPQCPVCAEASKETWPTLVNDYVRTGKVKLDARVLQFLGPDSVAAARFAAGARDQGRLWPFLAAFYAAQGQENSGYVTADFLQTVAKASGVDYAKARAYADSTAAATALNTANSEARALGVNGTPTYVLRSGKGDQRVLDTASLFSEIAG